MFSNKLVYYKNCMNRARQSKIDKPNDEILSCFMFHESTCNTRTRHFLLHHRELLRCCAVHVFELVFAYLAMCSHKLANGDMDNLTLSFLTKVNKETWLTLDL